VALPFVCQIVHVAAALGTLGMFGTGYPFQALSSTCSCCTVVWRQFLLIRLQMHATSTVWHTIRYDRRD